jgi:transcriptional regulator with XRE-family HTH domain
MRCQVRLRYFFIVPDKKSQQAVCSRVAQILHKERENRGLSMNVVAERAGLSQQMVSYVERQMRNPTLETLLRIAAAIGVDFAQVMKQAMHGDKGK